MRAPVFWPDWYFSDITNIPAGFFKKNNIKYLVCDIDGTLVPYHQPHPSSAALAFLKMAKKEGVKVVLVSNNSKLRVATFAKDLDVPAVCNAHKPLRRKMFAAMKELGVTSFDECAMIGDQIFTDVLVARRLGISAILVHGAATEGTKSKETEITEHTAPLLLKGYVKKYPVNSAKRLEQE